MTRQVAALIPPRLEPGDRVRLVSPASFPTPEGIEAAVATLTSWGLQAEVGEHALDQFGFMAGTDTDRLADMNDALRDAEVRAHNPRPRRPARASAENSTTAVLGSKLGAMVFGDVGCYLYCDVDGSGREGGMGAVCLP